MYRNPAERFRNSTLRWAIHDHYTFKQLRFIAAVAGTVDVVDDPTRQHRYAGLSSSVAYSLQDRGLIDPLSQEEYAEIKERRDDDQVAHLGEQYKLTVLGESFVSHYTIAGVFRERTDTRQASKPLKKRVAKRRK